MGINGEEIKENQISINEQNELALEIIDFAKAQLMVEMRYMDIALNRPHLFVLPGQKMATDGNAFGYDPAKIVYAFKREQTAVTRLYLHTVLHCVFRHVFLASRMDKRLWNVACDVAVEYVINDLDVACVKCEIDERQKAELDILNDQLKEVTAEKIYSYYRDLPISADKLLELERLFHQDEHFSWYSSEPMTGDEKRAGGNRGRYQADNEKGKMTEGGGKNSDKAKKLERPKDEKPSDPEKEWEEIERNLKRDMMSASRKKGLRHGSLMQALAAVNAEKFDYSTFLRRFAVMGEHLKINQDEFDYIFYTYGLQMYKNLPLVEPLEYSEDYHVKEFVIAIDTSGSVKGKLVQAFVEKTYNILMSTQSFAERINIHIIQCDMEIKEHVKITRLDEFVNYMRSMTLKGFGGTDYKPVFEYIDSLIEKGEFKNLKGMIYFTDGYGEFPKKKPPYETAFVFLADADNNKKLPPWAIRMVLPQKEIME